MTLCIDTYLWNYNNRGCGFEVKEGIRPAFSSLSILFLARHGGLVVKCMVSDLKGLCCLWM